MRHHRRLKKTFLKASATLDYLIFITVHHAFRFSKSFHKLVVAIYFDYFRTVDVVNADIAFCTIDNTLAVVETEGSCLQVRHLAVSIAE